MPAEVVAFVVIALILVGIGKLGKVVKHLGEALNDLAQQQQGTAQRHPYTRPQGAGPPPGGDRMRSRQPHTRPPGVGPPPGGDRMRSRQPPNRPPGVGLPLDEYRSESRPRALSAIELGQPGKMTQIGSPETIKATALPVASRRSPMIADPSEVTESLLGQKSLVLGRSRESPPVGHDKTAEEREQHPRRQRNPIIAPLRDTSDDVSVYLTELSTGGVESLRKAFVLSEVLGPPAAVQDYSDKLP